MLTNQEKLAHYKKLSEQSKQLHAAGNLKERNKLCEPIRQLYREIDWGFKAGEKVLLYSGNRKVPVKILAHLEDNYFDVRKDSGGDLIVPGMLLTRAVVASEEVAEVEQLALF